MQPNLVTISNKWQVVIPKKTRKKLNIKPKDKALVFPAEKDSLLIKFVGKDIVQKAYGMFKKYDTDGKAFERLLKQKREDLKLEDRKYENRKKG